MKEKPWSVKKTPSESQSKKDAIPSQLDLVGHLNLISLSLDDYFKKPSITMFDPVRGPDNSCRPEPSRTNTGLDFSEKYGGFGYDRRQ